MNKNIVRAALAASLLAPLFCLAIARADSPAANPSSPIYRVRGSGERQEMTVNTSRILELDHKIPQAQVNNPDILDLTPLSPTKIQVFAKKTGVTQVNLWDEKDQVYTIDVIVFGDTRELSMLLASEFPNASIQVKPVSNGVLISGYVDQPDHVTSIVQIAEQYYPRILTNIQVGGVHQVLLHIKVIEVSRTKLRSMGFDWAQFSGDNLVRSGAAGVLSSITRTEEQGSVLYESTFSNAPNFEFHIFNGDNVFFGFLDALRQNNFAKVLSEPTLVTVSGRPAYFHVGGEVPIITGGGVGVTPNTEYKKYGTQVDFVPIVLGNGRIRLEVRPSVKEIDASRSAQNAPPSFRVREVDTGVEMMAGQTLALAGLVQNRIESANSGLPFVSDLPYLGVLFRHVHEENNEVELLVLVTPELAAAMDPCDVPAHQPGSQSTSPSDCQLYLKGHVEVPLCCQSCSGYGCPQCGQSGFVPVSSAMPSGTIVAPGQVGGGETITLPQGQPLEAPGPMVAPSPPVPSLNGTMPKSPAPSGPAASGPAGQAPSGPQASRPADASGRPAATPRTANGLPGFMGPVGYEAVR